MRETADFNRLVALRVDRQELALLLRTIGVSSDKPIASLIHSSTLRSIDEDGRWRSKNVVSTVVNRSEERIKSKIRLRK